MIKIKKSLVCPRNKRFVSIYVCASSCSKRCELYREYVSYAVLHHFVEKHPEYEIIGEIMPVKKNAPTKKSEVKQFWILKEEEGKAEKTVTVVTEEEIINNPLEYMNAEIWDRPPYKYELVVALKKVKA